jgi:sialate O-acetylesterase
MKKNIISSLLILICSCSFLLSFADVRLPAIIGSHMVLQQNSDVKIWGWADPSEKISITTNWDTATITTSANSSAKWNLLLKTPIAGGPYTITIKAKNTIVLQDVLVGEVWTCSGQSNMEMNYNWGIKEYTADADNANNKQLRFFQMARLTAEFPQDDTKGNWVVCNPDDMKRFSLLGYFFGQQLQQSLKVPVVLINASWGGTPAEVWTPKDAVENDPILQAAAKQQTPKDGWPVSPGYTYNAMINPITQYNIAGVIWYQGESNVGTAGTYQALFTTMINSWRKAWQKELPFYFVQIAPFSGYGGISGALLREAQTKTLSVPNTGMVVIHDLVTDVKDIHPHDKKDVATRLANYALAETYGKKELSYKSPLYKSMAIEKDKIRINFTDAEQGLVSKGVTLTDFFIAGEDKNFMPATAVIKGNTVVVSNKNIKHPVAVRFGFTNDAMPNLFGKDGLPVNIFRTDDWNDITIVK